MTREVIIKCSDECRGGKDIYGEPITEVVRCKDCRLAQDDTTHLYCSYFGHKVYEDDFFCAYGERREP